MNFDTVTYVCYACGNREYFVEDEVMGEFAIVCDLCGSGDTGEQEVFVCSACAGEGVDEDDEKCDWCEGFGWV